MEFEVLAILPRIDVKPNRKGQYEEADVILRYGEIDLHGFTICRHNDGDCFVSVPSHRSMTGNWTKTVHCTSQDVFARLKELILEQYDEEFGE